MLPENFTLMDWWKENSLSRKTEGVLIKEELDAESIFLLDYGEIRELGLPLGQRKLLQKAIAELWALLHPESAADRNEQDGSMQCQPQDECPLDNTVSGTPG